MISYKYVIICHVLFYPCLHAFLEQGVIAWSRICIATHTQHSSRLVDMLARQLCKKIAITRKIDD